MENPSGKATMQSDQIWAVIMIVYTGPLLQTLNHGCTGGQMRLCISCLGVRFHILLANINITIICDTTLLSWEWRQQIPTKRWYLPTKQSRPFHGSEGISPRRTECYPSAVQVGFAVGKVTLRQVFPSAASHQRSLLLRSSDVDSITHWQHRKIKKQHTTPRVIQ
jgi:hypothetical protein